MPLTTNTPSVAAPFAKLVAAAWTVRLAVPVLPVVKVLTARLEVVPTVRPPDVMVAPPSATVRPFWCNVRAPSPVSVEMSTELALAYRNLNKLFAARDVLRWSTFPEKDEDSATKVRDRKSVV